MTARTVVLLMACGSTLITACAGSVASTEPCPGQDASSQALYGADAEPSEVPLDRAQRLAIVALYGPAGPELGLCTGTLISARWVLTAAHCRALPATELAFGDDAFNPVLRSRARSVAMHPSLDLMLLELDEPEAVAALGAEPMARATMADADAWLGARAQLAGFGLTEGGTAGRLSFADEAVVQVDEHSLEVDGAEASGACLGDSGGPLVVESEGGPVLVGVLSVGAPTCDGIDAYTRLDVADSWIDRTVGPALRSPAAASAAAGCPGSRTRR